MNVTPLELLGETYRRNLLPSDCEFSISNTRHVHLAKVTKGTHGGTSKHDNGIMEGI